MLLQMPGASGSAEIKLDFEVSAGSSFNRLNKLPKLSWNMPEWSEEGESCCSLTPSSCRPLMSH
jgi:hypothetical protein